MKIGIYSVTYRGVWYQGEALDMFSLMRLARNRSSSTSRSVSIHGRSRRC